MFKYFYTLSFWMDFLYKVHTTLIFKLQKVHKDSGIVIHMNKVVYHSKNTVILNNEQLYFSHLFTFKHW